MKPTTFNTLYASSRHLALDDRNIGKLSEIAAKTNAFCVDGSDELIHISLIRGNEVPHEDVSIPLELRKLMEFMDSHEIYDVCLAEEYDELPCLDLYEDDYVFSFALYAKIAIVSPCGQHSIHTCSLELEPHVMVDHRIFEDFRDTCANYAIKKLNASDVTVTFIDKETYDRINKQENCRTTCSVHFDENGYTVTEDGGREGQA